MIALTLYVLGGVVTKCLARLVLIGHTDRAASTAVTVCAVFWPILAAYVIFDIVWTRCVTR